MQSVMCVVHSDLQAKQSCVWTIKACERCKGNRECGLVQDVLQRLIDFLTCENKIKENVASLRCFCRRPTCLRAHRVLILLQSWFLTTAAGLLLLPAVNSEVWNIQSSFSSRSVKAQLTGHDLFLTMWTNDINKDGWRVPTSSHCTQVKPQYPGY